MRFVAPSNPASVRRLLAAAEAAEPTYAEHGATLTGLLPGGYHHLHDGMTLGRGSGVFAAACEGLRTWRAHRIPGARVFPADRPVQNGATVVVTLGARRASIAVPCRVIDVVAEPGRFGFAYGTLPGHPEQGEEAFVVTIADDEVVRFDITAFSRPGDPLTALAGPFGRRIQSLATREYLRALGRYAGGSGDFRA